MHAYSRSWLVMILLVGLAIAPVRSGEPRPLPGTELLAVEGDIAAQMVEGLHRHLDRLLAEAQQNRERLWDCAATPLGAGHGATKVRASVGDENRSMLREILGAVDELSSVRMQYTTQVESESAADSTVGEVGRGPNYGVLAVAWTVFRNVQGEGLLLVPECEPKADVIAIPDCEWTPEQAVGLTPGVPLQNQFPRRFAEAGCRVLVPALIDRGTRFAGNPGVRQVKHSQRETLWRASYELGRTPLGYEIQKLIAAADWLVATRRPGNVANPTTVQGAVLSERQQAPQLGVIGYGEGGLQAFMAGALDKRFKAVGVCGAFGLSSRLPEQPIDRNVWAFSELFGDAELAAMIHPRCLCVEHGCYPESILTDEHGGAPGRLWRPGRAEFDGEVQRVAKWQMSSNLFVSHASQDTVCAAETSMAFLKSLAATSGLKVQLGPLPQWQQGVEPTDTAGRTLRQYRQILDDTQQLMVEAEYKRREFWKQSDMSDAEAFNRSAERYREYLRSNVLGVLHAPQLPPNPRTRLLYETNNCRGYEVLLDVCQDVIAYGILVAPDNIAPGERRPVVVCQHGLEGRPSDVASPYVENPAYHRFAWRLAGRGFVTFAPQNPCIGGTRFRQLQRKAQPLGLTLWSFIVRQHETITDWLAALPFVDPNRIGFYGLSYGGKTALRVPPMIARYCLSICSADFNEWIWKNVSARAQYSYLWTPEYDMPEWNLGNTFNHAELAWLVFPRPFMVERGHNDGVAPDEWVAYEYARVRRHYVTLGLGDRTEIEFFNGPHTINGAGTFDFLHRHLRWPASQPGTKR